MKNRRSVGLTLAVMLSLTGIKQVTAEDKWFVRSHFGYSQVSDQSASVTNFETGVNSLGANVDAGFTSGLGVGYQINSTWAAELGWEYRSNDAEVTLNNGDVFSEGNYASNMFYVNGIYSFSSQGAWQPYAGVGLIWVQEIDIDLEGDGREQSFSADGDIGYQAFIGVNRKLSKNWFLQGEVRYGSISNIGMKEEGGTGNLDGFDYKPITVQLGLGYRF